MDGGTHTVITVQSPWSCGYLTETADIGAKSHAILAVHITALQRSDYRITRLLFVFVHSKTCTKRPLSKRSQIGFQDQLSLHAGLLEHSAILSTFIRLPFVIKIFVLSIF